MKWKEIKDSLIVQRKNECEMSLNEYRETFLQVPKIINRKTVFISEDVRDDIDNMVRHIGSRGMSVSGFIENLARYHLEAYAKEFETWRKQ